MEDVKTVKLRMVDTNHHNSVINVPVDGAVQLTDGVVEVSEECAGYLLTSPDWEKHGEINPTEDEGDQSGTEDEKDEKSGKSLVEQLDLLDLEALIEIAQAGKYKGWHLFKANVNGLRAFLKKKLPK